mmetsp:Transcript_17516/g.21163  ORF Transcript_17516/g.21163 Transcript_17516/m.21163 type:complete len:101 (+) Transcript_17516:1599-1901(+)
MTCSTPVVKVRSHAIERHNRPTSIMVPFRRKTCTVSPFFLVASGSSSVSLNLRHIGVQIFPGQTTFTRKDKKLSLATFGDRGEKKFQFAHLLKMHILHPW